LKRLGYGIRAVEKSAVNVDPESGFETMDRHGEGGDVERVEKGLTPLSRIIRGHRRVGRLISFLLLFLS